MAHHVLGTFEFRTLESFDRALTYRTTFDLSFKDAAAANGFSTSALKRGSVAIKDGRDPGVIGRPNHLNSDEMQSYIEWVEKDMSLQIKLTIKDLCRMVRKILKFENAILFYNVKNF